MENIPEGELPKDDGSDKPKGITWDPIRHQPVFHGDENTQRAQAYEWSIMNRAQRKKIMQDRQESSGSQ